MRIVGIARIETHGGALYRMGHDGVEEIAYEGGWEYQVKLKDGRTVLVEWEEIKELRRVWTHGDPLG